jgi:NADH-quinone oxidoreductase subunit H
MQSLTPFQLFLIASLIKIALVLFVLLTSLAYIVWVERKVAGRIQNRWGPTRTGPHGLLQPLADLVKFIFKEDPTPVQAEKFIYFFAPFMSLVLSLIAITVIPFGESVTIGGVQTFLQISDLNVGILFIFAATSLGVYGIALAGWSSGSKYALLGGLRSSAQMISYELALSFSIVVPLLVAGSLSLRQIVNTQDGFWFHVIPRWNALLIPFGPIALITYLISAFAETNRVPFDLPEAEGELVAGYHTEYSSMKFAMFFTGEYANMVTSSCIATLLFLGGWRPPLPGKAVGYFPAAFFLGFAALLVWFSLKRVRLVERIVLPVFASAAGVLGLLFLWGPFREPAEGVFWFLIKVCAFLFLYIWIRWTLPRFRYDTLMEFGWKRLVPVTLANLLLAAFVIAWRAR